MLMLLKFRCKNLKRSLFLSLIFVMQVGMPSHVCAGEMENQSLQVHGFIAQGIIDVNGSSFVNDDGKISAELTEVGVNASYRLNNFLRLTGQAVYLNGGNRYVKGARIDYALLDFNVYQDEHWLVNLYLGRFKNNNWLYSTTRDVPHARPSIILPQSVYFDGFRDIAMGSDGAAFKASYASDDYGDFDFYMNYGSSSLDTEDVKLLLGDLVQGKGKQKFDAQAGLYWQPQFSPWQLGFSILDSDFNYQRAENDFFTDAYFSFQQYTGNLLYDGERWQFSTELFQQKFVQKGFYFDNFLQERVGQGIFVQSKYQYNNQLSLLGRVERFYADKDDKHGKKLAILSGGQIPSYFGYQDDITIGASYDLAESFRVQVEHHWVKGTARLTPIVSPNIAINNKERWNMWAVQLMYWF